MAKLGEGHAAAMVNLGFDELRGAVYPESNVAQPTHYGVFGHPTPGEVADARREPDQAPGHGDDHHSILAEYMRQSEGRDEGRREDPEPPMDRD